MLKVRAILIELYHATFLGTSDRLKFIETILNHTDDAALTVLVLNTAERNNSLKIDESATNTALFFPSLHVLFSLFFVQDRWQVEFKMGRIMMLVINIMKLP